MKLAFTGTGRAGKDQMIRTARALLGVEAELSDEADAIALAVCHLARRPLAAPGPAPRRGHRARALARLRPARRDHRRRRVIARLTGVVVEKGEDRAVLDVNGVGYLVHLSAASLLALPARGERVTLRTITHVREDALDLFGFATEEEEAVFRALIDVKGVGPRAAQNILSGIEPRDLAAGGGPRRRGPAHQGAGRRQEDRRAAGGGAEGQAAGAGPGRRPGRRPAPPAALLEQLAAALVNLGYKPAQAEQVAEALRGQAEGKALDELLREALKAIRG